MWIYVLLLFQSLIASGTHLVAKVVVRDIDPSTLTMLRSMIAAAGLFLLVKVRKSNFHFERNDWMRIGWLSLLAIPINQFFFLYAIKLTTPANAALLYGTTPAMVLLYSLLMKKERASWKKIIGVAIAFIGILIVVFEKGIDFQSDYTIGNLILFLAVIAWTLYTVQGKSMILKYGAFKTSAATMIFGAAMFLPFGFSDSWNYGYSSLTTNHWAGVLYLALGTSIFAYLLWYYALSRIEATKVAIFANLQPVLTTLLSFFLLGQAITPEFIFGGTIALSGVILAQFG